MLRGVPRLVAAVADIKKEDETIKRTMVEKAEADAAFAQREIERGFPLLHAHALVANWAALEATVEDAMVAFLVNEPEILRNEAFSKIKVSLADFTVLEPEERMRHLVSELERNQGVARKYGVDRFEALLEPFALGGAVSPETRKDAREMHHIRNVLVHRAGFADRRIVEGCPWLNFRLNQPVTVSNEALQRYDGSLIRYSTELVCRFGTRYGIDLRAEVEEPTALDYPS